MDKNTQLHAEPAQNCQCGICADETAVLGRDPRPPALKEKRRALCQQLG